MKRIFNRILCKIKGHKWSTMVIVLKAFEPWPIYCTRCGKKDTADYSTIGWKWYGGYGKMVDDHQVKVVKSREA